jgi:hypothetical protein
VIRIIMGVEQHWLVLECKPKTRGSGTGNIWEIRTNEVVTGQQTMIWAKIQAWDNEYGHRMTNRDMG